MDSFNVENVMIKWIFCISLTVSVTWYIFQSSIVKHLFANETHLKVEQYIKMFDKRDDLDIRYVYSPNVMAYAWTNPYEKTYTINTEPDEYPNPLGVAVHEYYHNVLFKTYGQSFNKDVDEALTSYLTYKFMLRRNDVTKSDKDYEERYYKYQLNRLSDSDYKLFKEFLIVNNMLISLQRI